MIFKTWLWHWTMPLFPRWTSFLTKQKLFIFTNAVCLSILLLLQFRMIYVSKSEADGDSKVILVPMPSNDVNDSMLPHQFVDLRSNFVKYYYYESLWHDPEDIFKFFEECPIRDWAKNSPALYLMKQLQLNRNGNRVWDCSAAEIVVIPISLGNYAGTRCGKVHKDWIFWVSQCTQSNMCTQCNQFRHESSRTFLNVFLAHGHSEDPNFMNFAMS